jgi:hypothetical protein
MLVDKSTTESTAPKRLTAEWLAQQLANVPSASSDLEAEGILTCSAAVARQGPARAIDAMGGSIEACCRIVEVSIGVVPTPKDRDPRRGTAAWLFRKLTESSPFVRELARMGALQVAGWAWTGDWTLTRISAAAEVQLAKELGRVRPMCDFAEAVAIHDVLREPRTERKLYESRASLASRIRPSR